MKPRERRKWLAEYIRDNYPRAGVDILDRDFVDTYEAATGAQVQVKMWGANGCPQLAADLLAMKRLGQLKRHRTGLGGNWQPGFPKWVWSYSLTPPREEP